MRKTHKWKKTPIEEATGFTVQELAAKLNVAHNHVYYVFRHYGADGIKKQLENSD
jgi:hypothetical protein